MFDFRMDRAEARREVAEAVYPAGRKAREMVPAEAATPLDRVDAGALGALVRTTDGATVVMLTYPGENLSLKTDAQRGEYAAANAQVLAGVAAEGMGISYVPERSREKENIARAAERIDECRRVVFDPDAPGDKECDRASLELLEAHVYPQLQAEAVSAASRASSTYLWLRFERAGDAEIESTVANLVRRMEDLVHRTPHVLDPYEALDQLNRHNDIDSVPFERFLGPKVVMPDLDE